MRGPEDGLGWLGQLVTTEFGKTFIKTNFNNSSVKMFLIR